MKRGEAKIGQRVRVPAWVFGNFADSRFLEATVTKESGGGWSEVVVEIEVDGMRRHVNVCWLEPADPLCSGCGQEVDPDYCHCGVGKESHRFVDDHPFIPMGCDCYRSARL